MGAVSGLKSHRRGLLAKHKDAFDVTGCLCLKRNCAARKQSSAKRKRNGFSLRWTPRRGSNLPNNGVNWPTGLIDTSFRFFDARKELRRSLAN